MPTPDPLWKFVSAFTSCPVCDALIRSDQASVKAHAEEHLNHPMIKWLKERKRAATSSD